MWATPRARVAGPGGGAQRGRAGRAWAATRRAKPTGPGGQNTAPAGSSACAGRPRGGGAAERCLLKSPQFQKASALRAGAGWRRAGRPGGGDRALPQGARLAARRHVHGRNADGRATRCGRDGGPRGAVEFAAGGHVYGRDADRRAARGRRDGGFCCAAELAPSRQPAAPLRAAQQTVSWALRSAAAGTGVVRCGATCSGVQSDLVCTFVVLVPLLAPSALNADEPESLHCLAACALAPVDKPWRAPVGRQRAPEHMHGMISDVCARQKASSATCEPASARRLAHAIDFPHAQRLRIDASHTQHFLWYVLHSPSHTMPPADAHLSKVAPQPLLMSEPGHRGYPVRHTPATARRRAAGSAAGPTRPSCAARAGAPRPARLAAAAQPRRPRPPAAARPHAPAQRPAASAAPRAPAGSGRLHQRVRTARGPHEARHAVRTARVCNAAGAAGGRGQANARGSERWGPRHIRADSSRPADGQPCAACMCTPYGLRLGLRPGHGAALKLPASVTP